MGNVITSRGLRGKQISRAGSTSQKNGWMLYARLYEAQPEARRLQAAEVRGRFG